MTSVPPDLSAGTYGYGTADLGFHHAYLLPAVERILARRGLSACRLLDLGCGNGSVAAHFAAQGYDVTGVDPSEDGIARGRQAYPEVALHVGSAYDDLAAAYGTFPVVLSLEVVEHLYDPHVFGHRLFDLVAPGGIAVVSTPYHGYLKNLALALTGKMETHFNALWKHGHIKFFSVETLGRLLRQSGFGAISFERVGRVPVLAKSMIAVAERAS
ncbi:MAG: methyltransferase domain-containing protein [Rhodothermales bacterium]